ncbi:MAG TPA: polysaccharide deacetylase family protein [Solirubrobacteraceae bacterium]
MDDSQATAARPSSGSGGGGGPRRGPSGHSAADRARIVRRRRRRAGALLGIALAALVLGMVLGAVARGGGRHRGSSATHGPLTTPGTLLRPLPIQSASLATQESEALQRTRLTVPIVRMAGGQHREIALTFDDGPGPYTPAILRILVRTHTPATFFEVGEELRYFNASTAEIVRLGDPVGDHTWSHPDMAHLSRRRQQRQLLREAAIIGNEGARFPQMYRPPFGRWNETTLSLLRQNDMLMVLWSVDTDDWERPGTDQIVHNALSGAKPGAIILLHDGGGDRAETVAALPAIIRGLRRRGYRLVTVPRLLLDNPPPRDQDVGSVKGQGG